LFDPLGINKAQIEVWWLPRSHCEDGHQAWPAKGRHTRYTAEINRRTREEHHARDVGSLRPAEAEGRRRPRLRLVDLDTGEINDL